MALMASQIQGTPARGPNKGFVADALYIWVSKFGSRGSNSMGRRRAARANWGNRYNQKNAARRATASKGGV